MTISTRSFSVVVAGLFLVTCSAPSRAHTFVAPTEVQADATGAFSYNAVFTVSSPVTIVGWTITPGSNTLVFGLSAAPIVFDCFCGPGCPAVPGTPFLISVSGSLVNRDQKGTFTVEVLLRDGETFEVTTTIKPFLPIPALSEWGIVVLTLLLLVGIKIRFGRIRSVLAAARTIPAAMRVFLAGLIVGVSAIPADQTAYADYPPSVEELRQLVVLMKDSVALDPPQGDIMALREAPDPTAPVPAISAVILLMEDLLEDEDDLLGPEALVHLRNARDAAELGLEMYGSGDPVQTLCALREAAQSLQAVAPSPHPQHDAVEQLSMELATVAQRMAGGLVEALERGSSPFLGVAQMHLFIGDLLRAGGQYVAALVHFGGATDIASRGIGFHIDLFEQNIRDALAGETIGYAYTIGLGGEPYSQDGVGDARTAADSPQTDQSPVKEMYIASVSKTISALALLIALDEKGISENASIKAHLPGHWEKGPGVNNNKITFRHLLTHTSGLTDKGLLLDDLKETIRLGFCRPDPDTGEPSDDCGLLATVGDGPCDLEDPSDLGSTCLAKYTNANYSLMRVLIPRITVDPDLIDFYANEVPVDGMYAGLYSLYVIDRVLEPAGISVSGCSPGEKWAPAPSTTLSHRHDRR